jgi:hypothetical protein
MGAPKKHRMDRLGTIRMMCDHILNNPQRELFSVFVILDTLREIREITEGKKHASS